jgi:hypothetical protein
MPDEEIDHVQAQIEADEARRAEEGRRRPLASAFPEPAEQPEPVHYVPELTLDEKSHAVVPRVAGEKSILRNIAQCDTCGAIIESASVHDLVTCRCGSLSVDGGTAYLRRLWASGETYTELSVYGDVVEDEDAS